MMGAVPSFHALSCSSDGKLSNGAKIAAIYLVFTFRILRNSCKRCAIIVLFTGLNTFTSFDAPSRDMCGWSMHSEVYVQRVIRHVIVANKILSAQLESTHCWSVDGSKELEV